MTETCSKFAFLQCLILSRYFCLALDRLLGTLLAIIIALSMAVIAMVATFCWAVRAIKRTNSTTRSEMEMIKSSLQEELDHVKLLLSHHVPNLPTHNHRYNNISDGNNLIAELHNKITQIARSTNSEA